MCTQVLNESISVLIIWDKSDDSWINKAVARFLNIGFSHYGRKFDYTLKCLKVERCTPYTDLFFYSGEFTRQFDVQNEDIDYLILGRKVPFEIPVRVVEQLSVKGFKKVIVPFAFNNDEEFAFHVLK